MPNWVEGKQMNLPDKKYAVIYADPPWSYRQCGTGPKSRGNAAAFIPGVVESAPRVAPEGVRPVAHIAWRKRPKQFVVYDPVPTNECLYDGKQVYTQRVLKLEEYTVPFCSNCDHRLDDCAGSFCPVCGSIIEERRRT